LAPFFLANILLKTTYKSLKNMIPLIGYSNHLSVSPGMKIEFKVSSSDRQPYDAKLVRVISGDPNPQGIGIRSEELPAIFTGSYPSRFQPVDLGSYARIKHRDVFNYLSSFTAIATIYPTTPEKGEQGIICKYNTDVPAGFALIIDANGCLSARLGDGQGNEIQVSTDKKLSTHNWYRVWVTFDFDRQVLSVGQLPLKSSHLKENGASKSIQIELIPELNTDTDLLIAAVGEIPIAKHFNGKIERPMVLNRACEPETIFKIATEGAVNNINMVAIWDFSQNIAGTRIIDLGPNQLDGDLINLPTRGVKGSNWSGSEMCWRHAPEQYGAIHFHDDDIYDCGWETDFSFTIPEDMRSGVYAARLKCGNLEEMIPFFVRPKLGQPQSDICVLIPTFTYILYGNHARGNTNEVYRERAKAWNARQWTPDEHPEYGLSTYNFHSDGSGICYASRLRPIMNMRSGFISIPELPGSGLRHFPADTHLFAWLEAMGHNFDVITDEDLHEQGVSLIESYKVVLTTTHPEYHTKQTLDALKDYSDRGGHLMYLGGNGFYWRIAKHQELDGVYEVRRAEGGIRAWAAQPGEYYHSFDGTYGGLWRRNGRPPQQLVGVGFSAQGFMEGTYYRRHRHAKNQKVAWIFAGVDEDILGDFGLIGCGAAGYELDRIDYALGTPQDVFVLASSEKHSENFILVHEEQLTHVSNCSGEPESKLIRADLIYYKNSHGGAVFSVGSISFCGSLSHNNYDNNISRITNNVICGFQGD
jgi:N,N-dimethylformamidase